MALDHVVTQRLVDDTAAELGIVGAQLAVLLDGEIHEFVTGTANAELDTPVTRDTLFQIGSTTKVYTAALVMQLAAEGVIDIDAPLITYLPELRLGDPETTKTVTPRHLMAMTSGLDNGPYTDTGRGDDCVRAYADLLTDIAVIDPPGAEYGYTNASTNLSGLLIERLSGRCWDDALAERLLRPAGLTRSASLFEELPYHHIAVGHTRDGDGKPEIVRPFTFSRGMGPAGSTLCASAGDMVRFGGLFLRGGLAEDGTRILSEDTVRQMHTPQVDVPAKLFADQWCLGPYRKVWDGVAVYGHSGTTPSASSTLQWLPEAGAAIATVVNVANRGYAFAETVIREVVRTALQIDAPQRPQPDDSVSFDPARYAGTYESASMVFRIEAQGPRLVGHLDVRVVGPDGQASLQSVASSQLLPLGEDRFLPADDAFTSNHRWDIAFQFGKDNVAERILNGAFAARRVR
ncbi:serine hydrolase domain-containing protein [Nocardia sp. NPDC088792]|uniref:serine hydrolase domain-containing protein n=1 Tax=Nocardia sp. NPDC088792 TaxID=3364332 RepID=UPI003826061A